MKIKRYMKPYTCGELQKKLKRDKRKLADLKKQWNEELKAGHETLVNGAYECYGSDFDLWEDNLFEWYMPKICTVESRVDYWKSRIRKRQFTHKRKVAV
ncbi:MAG: hypothetical protein D8H95_14930 [Lachnospiraceae bacterium]|nr:MAG: hypothetical protein D8H95_14930 [Lachnospiraceae bacterium]